MKKVVTTLTAMVFALGLTTAGYSQTTQATVKKEDKPVVQTTQTPAAGSAVKPMDKGKADEAAKTVAKEDPAKGKNPEVQVTKKDNGKKPAVLETKKDADKKPATLETKKEEKKDVVK
jgi:hypothetical protein